MEADAGVIKDAGEEGEVVGEAGEVHAVDVGWRGRAAGVEIGVVAHV